MIKKILSVNWLAWLIGIIGALSSVLTLFVEGWNTEISLKWLIFSIFIFLIIIFIMLKIISEIKDQNDSLKNETSRVIKYKPEYETFIITRTEGFIMSAIVTLKFSDNVYEAYLGNAYVSNIQDKVIHLTKIKISDDFKENYPTEYDRILKDDYRTIEKIRIKNYITVY